MFFYFIYISYLIHLQIIEINEIYIEFCTCTQVPNQVLTQVFDYGTILVKQPPGKHQKNYRNGNQSLNLEGFLVESRSDGLYYVYVYGLWRGKSKSQVRKATTSTFQTDFFIHLLCPPVHMARKKSTPKTPSSEPLFGPGGSEDRARSNSSGYLSDIFSEFTKHITPAFNHERPDR